MSDPMKKHDVWPKFANAIGLLSVSICPNIGLCDGKGTIRRCVSEDNFEEEPCQWCDERQKLLAEYQTPSPPPAHPGDADVK